MSEADDWTQTRKLAHPIHANFIHQKPGSSASYIAHGVIQQHMTRALGKPPSFEVIEIVRGYVPGIPAKNNKPEKRPLENAVVGVLARMSGTVDGELVTVTEPGACEHPHNDLHDGERLKKATSDAYKRCGNRFNAGAQLWNIRHDEYVLPQWLVAESERELAAPESPPEPGEEHVSPEEMASGAHYEPDDPGQTAQAERTMSIPEDAEQAIDIPDDAGPEDADEMAPAAFIGQLRDRSAALPPADRDTLRAWLKGEGLLAEDGRLPLECSMAQALEWEAELAAVEPVEDVQQ